MATDPEPVDLEAVKADLYDALEGVSRCLSGVSSPMNQLVAAHRTIAAHAPALLDEIVALRERVVELEGQNSALVALVEDGFEEGLGTTARARSGVTKGAAVYLAWFHSATRTALRRITGEGE